jgi:5-methylcytosine-specific restriction endonuclease McrA
MSEKTCIKCSGIKTGNDNSYCKSCKKEKSRAWRASNKDYYKKYYLDNKKTIDQYQKTYQEANPEKIKENKRSYQKRNPLSTNNWKIKNPEKLRAYYRKREALKRTNKHSPYTEENIMSTYGRLCNQCGLEIDMTAPRQTGKPGWENGLQIDHLIPISKGGPDTLENVRPTHGLCNLRKSNN